MANQRVLRILTVKYYYFFLILNDGNVGSPLAVSLYCQMASHHKHACYDEEEMGNDPK